MCFNSNVNEPWKNNLSVLICNRVICQKKSGVEIITVYEIALVCVHFQPIVLGHLATNLHVNVNISCTPDYTSLI